MVTFFLLMSAFYAAILLAAGIIVGEAVHKVKSAPTKNLKIHHCLTALVILGLIGWFAKDLPALLITFSVLGFIASSIVGLGLLGYGFHRGYTHFKT